MNYSTAIVLLLALLQALLASALTAEEIVAKEVAWVESKLRVYRHGFGETFRQVDHQLTNNNDPSVTHNLLQPSEFDVAGVSRRRLLRATRERTVGRHYPPIGASAATNSNPVQLEEPAVE